jgi:hypothetical protein
MKMSMAKEFRRLDIYSDDLNKAATLRLGLMLADKPGRTVADLELDSQDAEPASSNAAAAS